MIADVPLGVFLSGGVDSSTVVAMMQMQSSRPVKTFAIGFHESRYDEAPFARAVARHLGTEHHELYVTPAEAVKVIPSLPDLYDEPFADSSQIPTHLVSELARQYVTVSLSGDGGDELFGGYVRYAIGRRIARAVALPRWTRAILASLIGGLTGERWDDLGRLLSPLVRSPRLGAKVHKVREILAAGNTDLMYRELMSAWRDPAQVVKGAREPVTAMFDASKWLRLPGVLERMMLLDLVAYLPDDILVKVDRASMAVSLEAREPLLDHRLIEFAWSLPQSFKIRRGIGKWPLRQVLERYVPRHLTERPKTGFGMPVYEWLRGPLREWAESHLSEKRLEAEGYFDPGPIRQRWSEHLAGRGSSDPHLWTVLMFQGWLGHQKNPPVSACVEGARAAS
jgi:asparagine synthase (glutamine-hydrolysing)